MSLLWEVCCEVVANHAGWVCDGGHAYDSVAGVEWVEPARCLCVPISGLFDYDEGDG